MEKTPTPLYLPSGRGEHQRGFTLVEVVVAAAVFAMFAIGIYSALSYVFKVVYRARVTTIATALLDEELETIKNIPYENIGEVNGVPSGVLSHTKTVLRDGITFTLITTVRNIDDPFDGTLGGSPNDTAPADYKLVEMEATCAFCNPTEPLVIGTRISPRGLEGASQNGAIFINVFDANGLPVAGANVQVSSANPTVLVNDVTDNQGYLRIVDAPTGTLSYAITVSNDGYSSDYTVSASAANPNPVKPPANVVSQQVTNISFSIDRSGSIAYHTMSPACVARPSIPFSVQGAKLIGTNPSVYKYDTTLTSNGSGDLTVSNAEWDTYSVSVSGTSYDLVGSIPILPFTLPPGGNQDVTLLLAAHTSNSLLVTVRDAGTGLPLSNTTVQLTSGTYDQTVDTGLGYTRQTDWSGGSGQTSFSNTTQYYSDDGNVNVTGSAGDVKLRKTGSHYAGSGMIESSTFDLGTAVNFNSILITPVAQTTSTGSQPVKLQIATSNSSSPAAWNFLGPDGTSATYYSPTSTVISTVNNDKQYLRYRLYLSTDDTSATPQVSDIAFTYTTGCTPPGQSFFGSLSADTYTISVSKPGYTPVSDQIDVSGATQTVIDLSPS